MNDATSTLRARLAAAMGLDVNNLAAHEAAKLEMAVILQTEIDAASARQRADQQVDLPRVIAAGEALQRLLDPKAEGTPVQFITLPGKTMDGDEPSPDAVKIAELREQLAQRDVEIERLPAQLGQQSEASSISGASPAEQASQPTSPSNPSAPLNTPPVAKPADVTMAQMDAVNSRRVPPHIRDTRPQNTPWRDYAGDLTWTSARRWGPIGS